jgi:hypothetical protein
MSKKVFIISAILPLLFCGAAIAQQNGTVNDTVIKASTIEISQVYKPEVKQSPKKDYTPELPPTDNTKSSFDYTVPQQSLYYSYKSLPLHPLALGKDSVTKPFNNYIKAGLGNLSTIYLDAGINSIKGKNFESAIHLGLLSQKGPIQYQQQFVGAINADAIYHTSKHDWLANVTILHNNFYQYGYDHNLYPTAEAHKQSLSGGRLSLEMQPNKNNTNGIDFSPSINASYFTGSNISNETSVGFNAPITKTIDSTLKISAGLNGIITNLNATNYSVSNNIIQLSLGMLYGKNNFSFKAFLNPSVGQNETGYLLPDIVAKYKVTDWHTIIGIGLKGALIQNTYEQLFLHNPYTIGMHSVQTHSNELYVNFQKGFGNHVTFWVKGSWWQYNNLPMYVNNTFTPEKINVIYDPKVNALSLQAGLRYQIGNTISVGASTVVFNYYKKTYSRVWQEPGLRFNADLSVNPVQALTLTAYASFVDQIYAIDHTNTEIKLNSYLDLGLSAEYQIMHKLSLFININNLLNNKYQRWYAYQAYGINIYGGLRFKF